MQILCLHLDQRQLECKHTSKHTTGLTHTARGAAFVASIASLLSESALRILCPYHRLIKKETSVLRALAPTLHIIISLTDTPGALLGLAFQRPNASPWRSGRLSGVCSCLFVWPANQTGHSCHDGSVPSLRDAARKDDVLVTAGLSSHSPPHNKKPSSLPSPLSPPFISLSLRFTPSPFLSSFLFFVALSLTRWRHKQIFGFLF
jgi:hypothetical protein